MDKAIYTAFLLWYRQRRDLHTAHEDVVTEEFMAYLEKEFRKG